jgi:transcriptional regulator with XRE-family HTH domain
MSAVEKLQPQAEAVLAKAVLRAAEQLGLNQSALAAVLGLHPSAVSRFKAGRRVLDPGSKEGELALLLIRLARSLFVLTGGDTRWIHHFMATPNRLTGAVPGEQIRQIQGLVQVLQVVDALRGKV